MLQQLNQGTKTVEELDKEMEVILMRAHMEESEKETIIR
jgi:hypothetical protein